MDTPISWTTAGTARHPNFAINRRADGVHWVILHGELDLTCESALQDRLDEITHAKLRRVVVDFADAQFVGLGVFVRLIHASRRFQSCEFRSLSPLMRRVLDSLDLRQTSHLVLTRPYVAPVSAPPMQEPAVSLVRPDDSAVSA